MKLCSWLPESQASENLIENIGVKYVLIVCIGFFYRSIMFGGQDQMKLKFLCSFVFKSIGSCCRARMTRTNQREKERLFFFEKNVYLRSMQWSWKVVVTCGRRTGSREGGAWDPSAGSKTGSGLAAFYPSKTDALSDTSIAAAD